MLIWTFVHSYEIYVYGSKWKSPRKRELFHPYSVKPNEWMMILMTSEKYIKVGTTAKVVWCEFKLKNWIIKISDRKLCAEWFSWYFLFRFIYSIHFIMWAVWLNWKGHENTFVFYCAIKNGFIPFLNIKDGHFR